MGKPDIYAKDLDSRSPWVHGSHHADKCGLQNTSVAQLGHLSSKNLAMGAIKIWQIILYDGYLGKYNMIL